MKKITIIILVLFNLNLYSQIGTFDDMEFINGVMLSKNPKNIKRGLEGSPYLDDNWHIGTIKLYEGGSLKNYPLRYDIDMAEIEIKIKGGEVKVVPINTVKEFTWTRIDGNEEIFKNVAEFNLNSLGVFQLISEGNISLLKKTSIYVEESNYDYGYRTGHKNSLYKTRTKYFIFENGIIRKVKKNKKHILKTFKKETAKVEKYVKENNLNYKKDKDLDKIFSYYNNL